MAFGSAAAEAVPDLGPRLGTPQTLEVLLAPRRLPLTLCRDTTASFILFDLSPESASTVQSSQSCFHEGLRRAARKHRAELGPPGPSPTDGPAERPHLPPPSSSSAPWHPSRTPQRPPEGYHRPSRPSPQHAPLRRERRVRMGQLPAGSRAGGTRLSPSTGRG